MSQPVADNGPPVAPAKRSSPARRSCRSPFIFWGGDVATFVANGGLETTKDSILARQGLNVKLTPGDDFDQQVKDYLDNKSPFLRGTLSMLGQASDKLNAKPETKPVVFLQLTWSAGDHLVGRSDFKTLNDLKGKKIALQKGGPHVGMLNDILRTAQAGLERHNGGLDRRRQRRQGAGRPVPQGREHRRLLRHFAGDDRPDRRTGIDRRRQRRTPWPGARRRFDGVHEPFHRRRVRLPPATSGRATGTGCEKFAAGYLKGCEELVDAKKKAAPAYKAAIHLAQDIWGKYPASRTPWPRRTTWTG